MSTGTHFNDNTYLHKEEKIIETVSLKHKQDPFNDYYKNKGFDQFYNAPYQSIQAWKVSKIPSDSTRGDRI